MPMNCHRGSTFHVANVVGFQSGNSRNSVNENGGLGPIGKAYWNAEEGMCDKETSVHTNLISNYNGMSFQLELESEPPRKRAKNGLLEGSLTTLDHKKATEKVLYKTRLCYQFGAGSCPFAKNCDFAHSMEELRELPHNWQEIVAAHKDEQMESSEQLREEFQIPIVGFNEETQGPNLRQQCKKFSTRVGCQFGENCISIHNYEERKSVAVCLLPGPGGGCERSGSKSNPGTGDGYESNGSKLTLNDSNQKTWICNKWESTGFCAYGKNYLSAHGYAGIFFSSSSIPIDCNLDSVVRSFKLHSLFCAMFFLLILNPLIIIVHFFLCFILQLTSGISFA